MSILYIHIILLCSTFYLHAAEPAKKLSMTKEPDLYEVTAVEYYGNPRTPNGLLLHALYTEHKKKFADAFCLNANPNICYGPHKDSALAIAAQHTTTPFFVKWLLRLKAHVNVRNMRGQTPLMAAAVRSDTITEYLLAHNADPSLVDSAGNNAFAHAVYFRTLGSFKHLMQCGVDLNAGLGEGRDTALIVAAHRGYPDLACALLSFGADPFITNKYGETPLHHAQRSPRKNPEDQAEEMRYRQTVDVLEGYTRYSRAIHGAAAGPLERIVASYLVCKVPDIKKSH